MITTTPFLRATTLSFGGVSWDIQFSSYLGAPSVHQAVRAGDWYLDNNPDVLDYYEKTLRCPEDDQKTYKEYSYAQNVYFNLDPTVAAEAPALAGHRWWKSIWLPAPSATVIYGEIKGGSNHFMAHVWLAGDPVNVAERHNDTANFVFADGHVSRNPATDHFKLSIPLVDNWNPATAR